MAKIEDRVRRFVVDGAPVATGVVAVGDAWACTNPSVGRGASLALLHAVRLRDVVRKAGTDDAAELRPAVGRDHRRRSSSRSSATRCASTATASPRSTPRSPAAPYETDDPGWNLGQALAAAAPRHPDLLRGAMDVGVLLDRGVDVLARDGMVDTLLAAGPADPPPGPSRAELVELIGTA